MAKLISLDDCNWKALPAAESGAAIISVLGLLLTVFTLPETKGKSLEELSISPSQDLKKAA